jgi:hypothetical protein
MKPSLYASHRFEGIEPADFEVAGEFGLLFAVERQNHPSSLRDVRCELVIDDAGTWNVAAMFLAAEREDVRAPGKMISASWLGHSYFDPMLRETDLHLVALAACRRHAFGISLGDEELVAWRDDVGIGAFLALRVFGVIANRLPVGEAMCPSDASEAVPLLDRVERRRRDRQNVEYPVLDTQRRRSTRGNVKSQTRTGFRSPGRVV